MSFSTIRQWQNWLALEKVRDREIKCILHFERRQSENVHFRGFQLYGLLDNEKSIYIDVILYQNASKEQN